MSGLKKTIKRVVVLAAIAVAGLGCFVVGSGLKDDPRHADVALVLGAKVYRDGHPSPSLEARLNEALRRYREGRFPLIVVSGGVGKELQDEAVVMRNYLLARGVPASAVVADSYGHNTYASAYNLRRIMRERNLHSAFVVTQYYHMPRSELALRRVGIEPVYGSHARYFERRDLYSIPREMVAYPYYALRAYPPPAADASAGAP